MTKTHVIKKWSLKHEAVVSLHLTGMSNLDIAEQLDYTPVRVSQILNSPQARQAVEMAKKMFQESVAETIEERLVNAADLSAKRIIETLEFDYAPGSDPRKHQDNVALKVLRGTGFLAKDRRGENTNGASNGLEQPLVERLLTALNESNEAKKLHEEPTEAEYEIVEEEDSNVSS